MRMKEIIFLYNILIEFYVMINKVSFICYLYVLKF